MTSQGKRRASKGSPASEWRKPGNPPRSGNPDDTDPHSVEIPPGIAGTCPTCGLTSGSKGHTAQYAPWCYAHREENEIWTAARRERSRLQALHRRRTKPEESRAVQRRAALKRYGTTPEWYAEKLAAQGGVCAISACGRPPSPNKSLSIDHDHECCGWQAVEKPLCGKCNRDLICERCNTGLGVFADDAGLVLAAAAYLLKHGKS